MMRKLIFIWTYFDDGDEGKEALVYIRYFYRNIYIYLARGFPLFFTFSQ